MLKLASDQATAHYLERLRQMTPAEKLETATELWYAAWELKVAGERLRNPTLSDEEIQHRVRSIFLRAST